MKVYALENIADYNHLDLFSVAEGALLLRLPGRGRERQLAYYEIYYPGCFNYVYDFLGKYRITRQGHKVVFLKHSGTGKPCKARPHEFKYFVEFKPKFYEITIFPDILPNKGVFLLRASPYELLSSIAQNTGLQDSYILQEDGKLIYQSENQEYTHQGFVYEVGLDEAKSPISEDDLRAINRNNFAFFTRAKRF